MATAPGELQAILKGIGAPVTPANIRAFRAWQQAEGGSAAFNPFNTTQGAPGAGSYNSVGVRSYTSESQGIKATVQTLENGHYGAIIAALKAGKNPLAVANAVGASPWGTSGSLMARILGGSLGSQPGPVQHVGAGVVQKGNKQFDTAQFKRQSGMLMMQDAVNSANGQPTTNLVSQLDALRQAATTKVAANGIPAASNSTPGTPGGSGIAGRVVGVAANQIGTPYVWGGTSKAGFDCSGLIQFAYAKLGIHLPRTAAEQGQAGRPVSYGSLKPGDLLVENNGDHVVMYAGNGKVIQAPHTGTNVQYSPLSYFPADQYNARRIVG